MIDLYTWLTPNGRKISLMLEETGLPYRAIAVDIGTGAQFDAEFEQLSPNNKIPAIVDHEGPIRLFESATILTYLAEKSGLFLPTDREGRWTCLQWLQFQAANVGPVLGQAQHFNHYASERVPYAMARYTKQAEQIYHVLDRRLGKGAYLSGDYSIADIATWPWITAWKIQGVDLGSYPNLARWLTEVGGRPAVQRERAVLAEHRRPKTETLSGSQRRPLFGG